MTLKTIAYFRFKLFCLSFDISELGTRNIHLILNGNENVTIVTPYSANYRDAAKNLLNMLNSIVLLVNVPHLAGAIIQMVLQISSRLPWNSRKLIFSLGTCFVVSCRYSITTFAHVNRS